MCAAPDISVPVAFARLRRLLLAAGCLAATAIATVAAAAAHASSSSQTHGLIAFTRYRLQNSPLWSEIWVVRPDGSGAHKVSHSARAVEDDGAQWSPRGDLIVFQRCRGNGPCSVWVVRPDGTGQHEVASCPASGECNVSNPSFTSDGKHVVWVHDWGRVKQGAIPNDDQIDHSAIVETDLSGEHRRILRRQDGYSGGFASPRLSPNGRKLLFDQYGWSPTRHAPDVLFAANIDGSQLHRITPPNLQAHSGSWSPGGTTILFEPSKPDIGELTPGSNLYTISAEGTRLRRVTDVGPYHYVIAGSFSPDGRSIVFATDADATPNPRGGTFADIYTQPLAGGSKEQVTHVANLDGWPSWGNA